MEVVWLLNRWLNWQNNRIISVSAAVVAHV